METKWNTIKGIFHTIHSHFQCDLLNCNCCLHWYQKNKLKKIALQKLNIYRECHPFVYLLGLYHHLCVLEDLTRITLQGQFNLDRRFFLNLYHFDLDNHFLQKLHFFFNFHLDHFLTLCLKCQSHCLLYSYLNLQFRFEFLVDIYLFIKNNSSISKINLKTIIQSILKKDLRFKKQNMVKRDL